MGYVEVFICRFKKKIGKVLSGFRRTRYETGNHAIERQSNKLHLGARNIRSANGLSIYNLGICQSSRWFGIDLTQNRKRLEHLSAAHSRQRSEFTCILLPENARPYTAFVGTA